MPQDTKTDSAIILALESSGNAASAAIMVDEKIAGFQEHKARHGHAETLIGLADEAAVKAGVQLEDITHIAAGCGPGSFTGLRVCLSAAKGYQLATGAKPLGISGLSALAYHAAGHNKIGDNQIYLCVADSRRGTFFAQLFDAELGVLNEIKDYDIASLKALIIEVLAEETVNKLVICGLDEEGFKQNTELADLREEKIVDNNVKFHSHYLDARDIAYFALASLHAPAQFTLAGLEPLYIAAPKLGGARP
ncbi:MAG: tRNA (adenosine(37)-N6)-threonylcarbamoyltransferase complex dimerization subunit type 1 TsaB [Alphaproteobacteria bacterium]|nr:tRNA (adenosine(37)-N6)-threonylcarbamoyltransferase complex dimerization subunit type 1 TsaB [Alphaproteobacteria bacterium]MBL6776343.1 tRNA (adenosine(37)-N6)-threonylcarbamoyltransferase complex dimerization subunit type 1 TsaB [Alphaproteobacteria bacterium]